MDVSSAGDSSDLSENEEEKKDEGKIPKRTKKADTGGLDQLKPSVPNEENLSEAERKR